MSVVSWSVVKTYALPDAPAAFIFDIDGTLYTNDEYVRHQIDVLVNKYAEIAGISGEAAAERVSEARVRHAAKHGGTQTSLGNALAELGIPISSSVHWREELIQPERYLSTDARLRATLTKLAERAVMVVLTNNPVSIGRRSLAALGVGDLFRTIVGLDTTLSSKPEPEPVEAAVGACGVAAKQIVSVGDRYDVDLSPALKLGCGGVLIEHVAEVYDLPSLFAGY